MLQGKGVSHMAQAWRRVIDVWEDLRVEVDQYREFDSERVLALTRFSAGYGEASGMEIGATQARAAAPFHVRGGKGGAPDTERPR